MYILKEKDGSIYARYTDVMAAHYMMNSTNVWRMAVGLALLTIYYEQ